MALLSPIPRLEGTGSWPCSLRSPPVSVIDRRCRRSRVCGSTDGQTIKFAAGERYLNRVWSSSIDGWIDEVRLYLGHARDQFRLALDKLIAAGEHD